MEKKFVIQNAITKQYCVYYFPYSEKWTPDIIDAGFYDNKKDALNIISQQESGIYVIVKIYV